MRLNFDEAGDGAFEDDGLSAEDLERIETVHTFFNDNYKSSTDPLNCVYLTTKEIFDSLVQVWPNTKLNIIDVDSWLSGSFRRKDIGGSTSMKIVWAVDRKVY